MTPEAFSVEIPLWACLAYYVACSAIGAMPAPEAGDSKFYRWLFVFLNGLAANVTRAGIAFRPRNGPGNGNAAGGPATKP